MISYLVGAVPTFALLAIAESQGCGLLATVIWAAVTWVLSLAGVYE